jgi:glycosyltransferase involved in cell wall biosynthesis
MNSKWQIGLVMQGDTNWMGGVEYIKNIVFALSTLPESTRSNFEVYLICDDSLDPSLYETILPHLKSIFFVKKQSTFKRALRRIKRLALLQSPFGFDFLDFSRQNSKHHLNFIYPCNSSTKKNTSGTLVASWIVDFQHKYLPDLFRFSDIFLRDVNFKYMSLKSSKIVVSSESAKKDLYKFFPTTKSDVKVLSFTTFPVADWYESNYEDILKTYALPQKFFLVSNQFWKHKNHVLVLTAMEILKKKDVFVNIVFTGKLEDNRDKKYGDYLKDIICQAGLNPQVYLLGLIPKHHQIQIMRGSLAMIQPSLFEGWSTTVEDARSLGKKIALSNIPVHLEQNPPGAVFFEKENAEELAQILDNWWQSIHIGYDNCAESLARKNALHLIQKIAYNFLEIAGASEQK